MFWQCLDFYSYSSDPVLLTEENLITTSATDLVDPNFAPLVRKHMFKNQVPWSKSSRKEVTRLVVFGGTKITRKVMLPSFVTRTEQF